MESTTGVQWDAAFEPLLRAVLPSLPVPLEPATELAAAGLDSLTVVELLVRVEQEYGIVIDDDVLGQGVFATPGALWEVVLQSLAR